MSNQYINHKKNEKMLKEKGQKKDKRKSEEQTKDVYSQ